MGFSTDRRYDAIIIGAGLGSLSCANHLVRDGYHVLVLEKHTRIGGYSQNFLRNEYEFDVSQHILPGLHDGGSFNTILQEMGVMDKLEVEERHPLFKSVFPDRSYILPGTEAELIAYLTQEFPGEADGINQFFQILHRIIGENFQFIQTGKLDLENYFPSAYVNRTYTDLLSECFKDKRLHGILGQLWQSAGLPNDLVAANWMAEVTGYIFTEGNYYIKGGGQRLALALGESILDQGSVLLENALVTQILHEKKVVKGVRLEDGSEYYAPVVVAGISPIQTYFDLIGEQDLPRPFIHLLNTLQPSDSILTMYLGLTKSPSELGMDSHTVFWNSTYDNHDAYNLAMEEHYDRTDFVASDYSHTAASPTHPTNHGILQLLELAPGKPWVELDKESYREKKQQIMDTFISKLDRCYPGIASAIDVAELATPRSMMLFTRNPLGAVYGWSQIPKQADFTRFSNVSTIKGLFLTGAWCRGGGGGYTGSIFTGRFTANEIQQRIDKSTIHGPAKSSFHSHSDVVINTQPEYPSSQPAIFQPVRVSIQVTSADIDTTGIMRQPSYMKYLYDAGIFSLNEHLHPIQITWREFQGVDRVTMQSFMVRLIFPLKPSHLGDILTIETSIIPSERGKAQLNQEIIDSKSQQLLCRAESRIKIIAE
jgi:all-trans-retinol 13,14-reductase